MTVISRPTIEILKNFCSINKSIVIKPGNKLSTLSINKNILAIAEVDEQFESQISIYDLGVFLGGLSLFDQPKIDTTQTNYVTVKIKLVAQRLDIFTQTLISSLRHQRKKLVFPQLMLSSVLRQVFCSNFNVLLVCINCQIFVFMELMV